MKITNEKGFRIEISSDDDLKKLSKQDLLKVAIKYRRRIINNLIGSDI